MYMSIKTSLVIVPHPFVIPVWSVNILVVCSVKRLEWSLKGAFLYTIIPNLPQKNSSALKTLLWCRTVVVRRAGS